MTDRSRLVTGSCVVPGIIVLLIASQLASAVSAAESHAWQQEIADRRVEYLHWVLEQFGEIEPTMKPLDGRAWSLNQARLFLDRDADKASRYFETVKLTADPDFMGIRLLKTLLDFGETGRLSSKAKENLRQIIHEWPMERKGGISRAAFWPPRFTENHDLMHLTIGLFSEQLRGQPTESHINELKKSLSWRFERGFYEWGSHRYQLHYSNPLIVLAVYAPDADIRRGAADLFSIMLAERALMSVGGYLGGPGMRSYDRNRGCDYLDNNRYDSFLPTVWLALGVGEPRFDFSRSGGLEPAGDGYGNGRDPRLNQDEGMFLATTRLTPHSIVKELLNEVATRPELVYTGRRSSAGHPFQNAHPNNSRSRQVVYYYNTPHVSLGSLQYLPEAGKMSVSYNSRPRFFSVMFSERPEQVLRTRLSEADLKAGINSYDYTADRVVQHRDWLIAAGELSASNGLTSRRVGQWDLFHVGRGLCAHVELDSDWHVFQVSDLDEFRDEESFVSALRLPVIRAGHAHGTALNGDRIRVDLKTMAIHINGVERPPLIRMLHDSPLMTARFGSGHITVRTRKRAVTLDNTALQPEPVTLPKLAAGHIRLGNARSDGETTKLAHVRTMGGLSPRDSDSLLKSVSILIPHNVDESARLAVYAGGRLDDGPQSGSPARLLFDFGQTPKGQSGWLTLEHPTGVRIPANTPIWVAWKGSASHASVMYLEEPAGQDDFHPNRGRWDSKGISLSPDEPWPLIWPKNDGGSFDDARYCCFLTLQPLRSK
jgi:hypothetical protein